MAAPRAEAQCPGPQPAFSAVVNEQPQLLQACRTLTPGGGCATPSPLVVDVSRTHAQETTLQATVPSGFTATSSHWLLERWNGSNWAPLWTHESIQGAPMAGGSVVSFGAPGLVENASHQARVSFCDDKGTETSADDDCFCWSSPVGFTTTAFEEPGPAPPLHVADPDRPGYSEPVWMRVEAWDVLGDPRPHFTGGIAWGNCPAGEPMSACQFYCPFPAPRADTGDPQNMLNAVGTWGAYFHEKNYAVEVFDAGSWPAP